MHKEKSPYSFISITEKGNIAEKKVITRNSTKFVYFPVDGHRLRILLIISSKI